jgi:hypothetical protein
MIKPKRYTHWLDFYPGGVPAGIVFDMNVLDACQIANTNPVNQDDLRQGIGAEFALIGLIAYFEGFCKNHTAAILNICPQLVRGLAAHGRDIRLRPVDILDYGENISTNFGSLVVEKIDFGTAKTINGLYQDLLGITPISKREADQFHALLEDRHLIVHHGNIFTPSYATERFIRREIGRSRIFVDSLQVTPAAVQNAARLLHRLSVKIRQESRRALAAFLRKNHIRLPKPTREALGSLDSTDPETAESLDTTESNGN